ncbi:MAG TPA: class I SAM-dependent methyltransferase [Bacteroidota bacterium]|nr:class I SAM-dependent methyltransferase [Bacteroidota bacterium]
MISTFSFLQDIAVRPLAAAEVRRLNKSGVPLARTLATCIDQAFHDRLSEAEQRLIGRIQSRRAMLEHSNEQITITDYGAGRKTNGGDGAHSIGNVARNSSKPHQWAMQLFRLIRSFTPLSCLELGTCLGISGMYEAAALQLNAKGKLVTLEGDESLAEMARRNFSELGFTNAEVVQGRFQDTLEAAARRICPIDFVFIDGHHAGEWMTKYFEMVFPFLSSHALVLFDDIHWSRDMKRAWDAVKRDPRILLNSDLYQLGITIVNKSTQCTYGGVNAG